MREVLKSNDPVLLHHVQTLLADAGIIAHLFDAHMSIMEGSIGILPRRVMVADEDEGEARALIRNAIKDA